MSPCSGHGLVFELIAGVAPQSVIVNGGNEEHLNSVSSRKMST